MRFLIFILMACILNAQVRLPTFTGLALTPGPQIASGQDAWSLFTNPAGLSFVEGAELLGAYAYHWENPTTFNQLHLSSAFSLVECFSLGLGLQLDQERLNGQLGLAYRFGRSFALSAWTLKQHRYGQESSDPFLLGLGFQYYPWEWAALGVVSKQVFADFSSPLEFQGGLSLRPFGSQFTLSAETRFWPQQNNWKSGYEISPIIGARLDFDGFSLISSAVIQKNWLFFVALDFNWENFGLGFLGGNTYIGSRFRLSSQPQPSLMPKPPKWVKLDLDSNGVPESKSNSILDAFFKKPSSPLLFLDALHQAAEDSNIAGVFVTLDSFQFGFARAEELRDSLLALKNSGKQVVVYLQNPNTIDYYVATAANQIYLNPAGKITLNQFQKTLVYLKHTLDKLGVEAEVIRAGTYKNAPLPLIANAPNSQELEVANVILDEQYEHFIEAIAQKIQKPTGYVKDQINLGTLTAPEALASGFVDVLYESHDAPELKNSYAALKEKSFKNIWKNPNQIAIIPILGTIIPGRSSTPWWYSQVQTGSEDIIEALKQASQNPHVKGILLRINSPGGDAFASDQIYKAVIRARQIKPIVASLSDVAASGGYYAAAGAHSIWAEPSTLTGSIGVFSLRFNAQKLFQQIGLSSFELKRGQLPGSTVFRPLSESERARGQQLIDWNYALFKQAVAKGQNLDPEDVSRLAEGRVWTGEQAISNKLIQHLGGFSQALSQIKSMAGLDPKHPLQLSLYEAPKNFLSSLSPFSFIQSLLNQEGRALTIIPFYFSGEIS